MVRGISQRALSYLEGDDAEWRIPWAVALVLVAVPVALAVVPVLLFPLRDAYRALLVEDGPIEWLQFGCLVLLAPIYVWLTVNLRRRGLPWLAGLYLVAAVGVVFIAGEEISWGQRLLGWATPEGIAAINKQGETNIHNVGLILRVFNAATMTIALLAVVLPIARWAIWPDRGRSLIAYALIPPIALAPAFALAFAYRAMRFIILPEAGFTITKYQEATELAFYFGLLTSGLLLIRALRHEAALRVAVAPSEQPSTTHGLVAPPPVSAAPGQALSVHVDTPEPRRQ